MAGPDHIPALARANMQLGLPRDFNPPTSIQSILKDAGLGAEVYTYLLNSETHEAKEITKMYFALTKPQRKKVTIDHLIAAAKLDHIKTLGAITEELFRAKGEASTLIAAVASPDAMRAASWYAGTESGHQDRKMILQTVKVAPVPTNQINRFNIFGNRVDNSTTVIANAPSLEEVVRSVDSITAALPKIIDVPSTENS